MLLQNILHFLCKGLQKREIVIVSLKIEIFSFTK